MMNLSDLLERFLTPDSMILIRLIRAEAERLGLPLYLVGGSVRDLMLGRAIKDAVGLPPIAVGLITEARQAEDIVAGGQADAVALARAMLYDPRWPWHAAAELGAQVQAPPQFWRSQPRQHKDLFEGFRFGAR